MNLKKFLFNIAVVHSLFLLPGCSSAIEKELKSSEPSLKNKSFDIQDFADHDITLLKPINAILRAGERLNLKIDISKSFHAVEGNPMGDYVGFVPKNETLNCWTEKITVQTLIGDRYSAKQALEDVKRFLFADFPSAQVLEESEKQFDTYFSAQAYILYFSEKGRAIVFVNYYSGPYDCSGLQYSMEVLDNQTDEQILEKLKLFAKKNIEIIKF